MPVLSSMTNGGETVELVIADAESDDRLYIPHNLFLTNRGTFEGSELFQLSGGVFKMDDVNPISFFFWGSSDDNEIEGNIEFAGRIAYQMDGSDLVITILQGEPHTFNFGTDEDPITVILVGADSQTETLVRVIDWEEGDLGITFPVTFDEATHANAGGPISNYPGFTEAVDAATSADKFRDPLDERPEPHVPLEVASASTTIAARAAFLSVAAVAADVAGTDGDDTLTAGPGGPFTFDGGAGNDNIVGSDGGDVIIGGTGADTMAGGRGNDAYWVDDAGDVVIEIEGGGFDKVYASIDYTLPDFVEYAVLEGEATTITGNDLDNRLLGNALNNTLIGSAGSDTLAGDLGDDILIGGEDGDAYVYGLGDGHDTIIETGTRGDDFIVLAGGLTFDDVVLLRAPTHDNDLVLVFSDGGSLTVLDYFAGLTGNIEGLALANGATLAGAAFAAAAQAAVSSVNFAPIARPDQYVYQGDDTVVLPVAALLDNDSDRDGDTLTVTAISNVAGGSAELDGNGHVVVTRSGSASNVTFDYTISDGAGGFASSTFEIAMRQNTAPTVTSVALNPAIEDEITLGQIFASDAESDTLVFRLKEGAGPAKGSVVVGDDGRFSYTPDANANGGESFVITVSDGFHAPTEAVVAFDIAAVNDAPEARDDIGFSAVAGQPLSISSGALLANDTDIDGDALVITRVSDAAGGTVILNADNTITFAADADFTGAASFSYTVSDGHGGTSSAVVTVDVTAPEIPSENIITGTDGRDILYSTDANDIFYGKGGRDTFVFQEDAGDDVIKDFQPGWWFRRNGDVLDLRDAGFDNYWDLVCNIQWSGSDTIIDLPNGGSVTLEGVLPIQLNIDNFKIF